MTDKKIIRIFSVAIFAVLLLALLLSLGESSRIVAAALLVPIAIIIPFLLKKRSILSINKLQILFLMIVIALVYLTLYYLTGTKFGFYKNPYSLNVKNLFTVILPIIVIIVCTEIIRCLLMAQKSRVATVLCYFSCVIAEILIVSNLPAVRSFGQFMSLVAGALFPALIANLLYNYLSARYGLYPNLIYRLLTTLYIYVIPIRSGISDAMLSFFRLLVPIVIYMFVDALYEKKVKLALGKTSRVWRVASAIFTVAVIIIMMGTVMLISNQFRYGALVIATPSMTGELNQGDVVIYESYDGQHVDEGQVIVFEKDDVVVVHRVIKIEIINGITRYYTQGDANDNPDAGYITSANIVGLAQKRLAGAGYPTLWMRSLFKR